MTPELMDEALDELRSENLLLRQLLWVWHGCPYESLGGGADRELHCAGHADGHPPIDFKRDSARSIERSLQQPSLDFIAHHQDDVCAHCGVMRWTWEATKPCSAIIHEWTTPRPEGGS